MLTTWPLCHFTATSTQQYLDLRHFGGCPSDQLINQALCESSIIMLTTRPLPAHNNDKDLRHFGSCPSDQLINQTLCASSRMAGSRLSDYFEKNLNGTRTTDERLTGVQQPFVLRGTIAFHQRHLVKICQLEANKSLHCCDTVVEVVGSNPSSFSLYLFVVHP